MALSRSTSLDTMYALNWQYRRREVIDQVMESTPLFYLLNKKGRMKTQNGGLFIEHIVRHGYNKSITSIGRGGQVGFMSTDVITTTYWEWKYITGHIIRYAADMQKNKGEARIKSRVTEDIDLLRDSMIDYSEDALFGDGTGNAGLDIDGLGNIVDPTPTGTVAGFDRATYTWWRPQTYSMSGESVTVNLLKRMRSMWHTVGKFGMGPSRFPDILITTQGIYEAYEDEVQELAQVRLGDQKMIDLGFGDMLFKGRPVTWSPSATSGVLRFLNTNFLKWTVDSVMNMTLGDWIPIADQPGDSIAHMLSACNLTCGNCAKQGSIHTINA